MIDFHNKTIHFIGIGGFSMSGLAEILFNHGVHVRGSDRDESENTARLRGYGVNVYIGHKAEQAAGADIVVYNSAIKPGNPEYDYAVEHGIPLMKRSELLGEIMTLYETPIVISGAHGKTTCTSMTATVFYSCGKDPTVHNGGIMPLFSDATYAGGQKYFIAEGCEYMENFLDFHPRIAVLLNIDADHLDYYRDIDHITSSFRKYAALVPESGLIIANGDDERCVAVAQSAKCRYVTFGFTDVCAYRAVNISQKDGMFSFDLLKDERIILQADCPVPGRHNIYNSLAALTCALECGIKAEDAAHALTLYMGAERRLQKIGVVRGASLYHDYAHHPSEIIAVLDTLTLMPHNRIIAVFQPHTYTRTRALFERFAHAFGKADRLIVLPIYAAREKDTGEISSPMLCDAINTVSPGKCAYADSFESAAAMVGDAIRPGDIVITLGAGSIEGLNKLIV